MAVKVMRNSNTKKGVRPNAHQGQRWQHYKLIGRILGRYGQ